MGFNSTRGFWDLENDKKYADNKDRPDNDISENAQVNKGKDNKNDNKNGKNINNKNGHSNNNNNGNKNDAKNIKKDDKNTGNKNDKKGGNKNEDKKIKDKVKKETI